MDLATFEPFAARPAEVDAEQPGAGLGPQAESVTDEP